MEFADIIVDISSENLDKTFQYRIPSHLQEAVTAGVLVQVPFGKSNRRIQGYVVSCSNTPAFPVSKLKEIDSVIQKGIAIEGQLIQLAAWIQKTYGGTMNQALKVVLPIKKQVKLKEKKWIHLAVEQAAVLEWLEKNKTKKTMKGRKRLLEKLAEEPVLSWEVVTDKLHIAASTIQGLEKTGMIRVEHVEVGKNPIKVEKMPEKQVTLNVWQQKACEKIGESMEKMEGKTHLLYGVTGSGKTEVYMELIARTLAMGKQAIVLIPEISLTYQTVMRFYHRFGAAVAIMHSRLSQGERYDQMKRAREGSISIMIGPRSALFTPFSDLGLIIMDEEQEGAYKSETVPKYHARETAVARAAICRATVVLGSATPSVNAYYRAMQGEYVLHTLPQRATMQSLAETEIVDLREELKAKNKSVFSRRLQELIAQRLERKEQIILFINRRGYAGFVSCRSCGDAIGCPHCAVSLTAHKEQGQTKLVCHYCGYTILMPERCPSCGSPFISTFGIGTQKVESMVKELFPHARVLRMDQDTAKGKDGHEKILSAFANEEADILIGTQMIVKGHDFPNVTLVGILAADLSLHMSDYMAAERTFDLLTQAAGRAGRGEKKGQVVIQTYKPEDYSILAAAAQNYEQFYETELAYRSLGKYPPVWRLAAVLFTSDSEQAAKEGAWEIKRLLEQTEGLLLVGPTEGSIARIQDIYRFVLYLRAREDTIIEEAKILLENAVSNSQIFKNISVQFDDTPMTNY